MQLGQILQRTGAVTSAQLETALRRQRLVAGRLGTNLVELGYTNTNQIAAALSAQHNVPAVSNEQLAQWPKQLAHVLPKSLISKYLCFPLAWSQEGTADDRGGSPRKLIIAIRDPLQEDAVSSLTTHLTQTPILHAAPEIIIYRLLGSVYRFRVPDRFQAESKDTPSKTSAVPKQTKKTPSHPMLVALDDLSVAKNLSFAPHRGQAHPGKTTSSDKNTSATQATVSDQPTTISYHQASQRLISARDWNSVSKTILGYLRSFADAAILLRVKNDLAVGSISLGGYGGYFTDTTIASITIPLHHPSWFLDATRAKTLLTKTTAPTTDTDIRFSSLFSSCGIRTRYLLPIVVDSKVVLILYAHEDGHTNISEQAAHLEDFAHQISEALERILRIKAAT